MPDSKCLRDFSLTELISLCQKYGSSEVRAKNLYSALNNGLHRSLKEITTVSNRLINPLIGDQFYMSPLFLSQASVSSKNKGTVKFLFTTFDGLPVESVLMPAPGNRTTLCLSSQCGCQMGCKFCNTGQMGLQRNLTAGEILDQFHHSSSYCKTNEFPLVTNIVFMGMGEPFDNYDNLMTAFETLYHPLGAKLAKNRITISTAGHLDGLKRFGEKNIRTNIAISLNATENKTRSMLMPINKKWPIEQLIDTVRNFPLRPGRVIVIEYVLINEINDRIEDAHRLAKLLSKLSVKVNLIAYNESDGLPYKSPAPESLLKFAQILKNSNIGVLVRKSMGADIEGACGQLGSKSL